MVLQKLEEIAHSETTPVQLLPAEAIIKMTSFCSIAYRLVASL